MVILGGRLARCRTHISSSERWNEASSSAARGVGEPARVAGEADPCRGSGLFELAGDFYTSSSLGASKRGTG